MIGSPAYLAVVVAVAVAVLLLLIIKLKQLKNGRKMTIGAFLIWQLELEKHLQD